MEYGTLMEEKVQYGRRRMCVRKSVQASPGVTKNCTVPTKKSSSYVCREMELRVLQYYELQLSGLFTFLHSIDLAGF